MTTTDLSLDVQVPAHTFKVGHDGTVTGFMSLSPYFLRLTVIIISIMFSSKRNIGKILSHHLVSETLCR